MGSGQRDEVQPKGHEIAEGDDKHPGGWKRKRSGLGENYQHGVGCGGYSAELDQAESQTGIGQRKKQG